MKFAYSVVFLVLAFTLSIFSSDTYAAVPPEGFPRFFSSVTVDLDPYGSDGGFTLTAKNKAGGEFYFAMLDGGTQYTVYNGGFELVANFNSASDFAGGSVAISGLLWPAELPPPSSGISDNLFSADLVEADASQFLFSNPNPSIGFRSLFSSFGGWAAQFANSDESVYLTLDPQSGNILNLFSSLFDGSTTTVTTVPVPPAVWLLISALASLSVIGRRRSLDSVA